MTQRITPLYRIYSLVEGSDSFVIGCYSTSKRCRLGLFRSARGGLSRELGRGAGLPQGASTGGMGAP